MAHVTAVTDVTDVTTVTSASAPSICSRGIQPSACISPSQLTRMWSASTGSHEPTTSCQIRNVRYDGGGVIMSSYRRDLITSSSVHLMKALVPEEAPWEERA